MEKTSGAVSALPNALSDVALPCPELRVSPTHIRGKAEKAEMLPPPPSPKPSSGGPNNPGLLGNQTQSSGGGGGIRNQDLRLPKHRPNPGKRYRCTGDGCRLTCRTMTELLDHMRVHYRPTESLEGKTFHCSTLGCTESFPNMQSLMVHTKAHYKPNRYFKCENCMSRFRTHRSLFKHLHSCSDTAASRQSPALAAEKPVLLPASSPEKEELPKLQSVIQRIKKEVVLPGKVEDVLAPDALPADLHGGSLESGPLSSPAAHPYPLLEQSLFGPPTLARLSGPPDPSVPGPFLPYMHALPQTAVQNRLRPFLPGQGLPVSNAVWKKSQGHSSNSRIVWEHTRGRYNCLQCPYSTASREEMTQHTEDHRKNPSPPGRLEGEMGFQALERNTEQEKGPEHILTFKRKIGRPASRIWRHFHITSSSEKKNIICKYCQMKYGFPNATRMRKHIIVCNKCPVDIKKSFMDLSEEDRNDESAHSVSWRSRSISPPPAPSVTSAASQSVVPSSEQILTRTASKKYPIISFADEMTPEEQEKIDQALARAIYSSGMPFSIIGNSYWREYLKLLRPSYHFPSRHSLSEPLLESEYERVTESVRGKINDALCLALLTDRWTNVRGEGIINFVITTPQPFFYRSIETGENKHTADYISFKICEILHKIGSGKVFALLTDNGSNTKAAQEILMHKYPHITAIGCASQGLNLLLNDIMKLDTLQTIYRRAEEIITLVKATRIVAAVFKTKQAGKNAKNKIVRLKECSKSRWSAAVIAFESLIKNKDALQETVKVEDLKISRNVRKAVLEEEDFWIQLQNSLKILKPISEAVAASESDRALLSEIPYQMAKIKTSVFENLGASPLTTTEESKVKDFIRKREELCCRPIHAAANLLDPRFKGGNISEDGTATAFEWITKQASHLGLDVGKVLSNVAEYRTSSGIWSGNAVWDAAKHIPPATWWQGLCATQPLAPLASRLLQIPPSSAACHRIRSMFGNSVTKPRNKLAHQRVEKLVSIRVNLRFLEVRDNYGGDKYNEAEAGTETDTDNYSSENESD